MVKGPKALVKPELLIWARQSAGLTIEVASKSITTPKQLELWERGETAPSIRQLTLLANKYKRPLSVFYLPNPPKDFQALKDFRRLPGIIAGVYSAELTFELRAAHERREIALDLYMDVKEYPPKFDLHGNIEQHPEELGGRIRKYLGISLEEQTSWRDARTAYNAWRNRIETAGVLVFQASRIEISEMRGFAIFNKILPVIAVNSKDHPHGRTFSLLHEFCHLTLGESILTDFSVYNAGDVRPPEARRTEIFCNQVAAAALMPLEHFLKEDIIQLHGASPIWRDTELNSIALNYGVSHEAVLRRLLYSGKTNEGFYNQKRSQYLEGYKEYAKKLKENTGGPPPHLKALGKLGLNFTNIILQNYYLKNITLNDVAGYFGLKIPYVEKLAHMVYEE